VYTRAALPAYGLQRALYDGAAMAFLTQLAPDSAPRMEALLRTHLLPGVTSLKVGVTRNVSAAHTFACVLVGFCPCC
jgi:midasin (ATPase involved in ribosome maturation)